MRPARRALSTAATTCAGVSHQLLVDRDDEVAALEAFIAGVAIGLDRGDDHAARGRRQVAARASSGVSGVQRQAERALRGRRRLIVGLGRASPPPPLSRASCSSVGRSPTVTVTRWRLPPRMMSSGTREPTGVLAIR